MTISIMLAAASASWLAAPTQSPVDSPAASISLQALGDAEMPARSERVPVRVLASDAPQRMVGTRINGQELTLELHPYSLRSADFEVWTQDPDGTLRRVDQPPPPKTYRGVVREWECSTVSASLIDGHLTAMVQSLDHGQWIIQPGSPNPAGDHVVYPADAAAAAEGSCGVTPEREAEARARRAARGQSASGGDGDRGGQRGGPRDTQISLDADFEFFQLNGSSFAATIDDIETVMVGVDAIYRGEVGINYVVNRIIIRTSEPDPYTSTNEDDLLDEFETEWDANHGGQQRAVAHLLTGKNIDGSTIGLAWIGVVCDFGGDYGFSQSRFSTVMASRFAVTAHELGHNWDAEHCNGAGDCSIMCSSIGGCSGNISQFGISETNQIVAWRDSAACLGGFDSTVYVDASNNGGFEEGSPTFPYNTLREGLWATIPGGTIVLFGGTYDFDRTATILNRPVTLTKQPGSGTVLIGQ